MEESSEGEGSEDVRLVTQLLALAVARDWLSPFKGIRSCELGPIAVLPHGNLLVLMLVIVVLDDGFQN